MSAMSIAPAMPLGRAPTTSSSDLRKVLLGSSLGTAFEWYDFFVYGTLAGVLGPLFFSKQLGDTGAFLASLATYGAGLALRPFGSVLFGRLGDVVGRKHTFLITIVLMGISTAGVGLLPTYETAGVMATVLLVFLRCLQGLALGGEYGGAATYVAEDVGPGRRGYATGWIQICATMGFFLSLIVVLATQQITGAGFKDYGWRIPFVLSILLLAVSVYIRLRLEESPVFLQMQAEGRTSANPITESFARWGNLKVVLLSLFGAVAGVGVVWYTGQFYALIFMQKVLKVEFATAYIMMSVALACAVPFFVICGWISDHIGRKPVVLTGLLLAALTYIPLFQGLTHYVNPALERAMATLPVTIASNDCVTRYFDGPQNDCERVKDFLIANGIPHKLVPAIGPGATMNVGTAGVSGFNVEQIKAALKQAGYPEKADPDQINYPMAVLILFVLAFYVCLSYGPIAAYLVELFPARIRYTSMSMPYHLGTGYFGGFMLYFATLITSTTGNIFDGLWYSIAIAAGSLIIGLFTLPETKDRDITT